MGSGGGGVGGVGGLASWASGSWSEGWLLVLGRLAAMLAATLDLIDLDRASLSCFGDLGLDLDLDLNFALTSAAFSIDKISFPHVLQ